MSDARSDGESDALAHRFLDGELAAEDRARFDARVAADPECARALARAALLHDGLAREFTSGTLGRESAARVLRPRRALRAAAAAALVFAIAALAWSVLTGTQASAAQVELARIVARAAGDRSYRIHVLADDTGPRRGDPRDRDDRAGNESRRTKPAQDASKLEGARLYVRGATGWALLRRGASGMESACGSDGHTAWNVPERGPVRVSSNPARFRGALPGEQHDLPFVDPSDGLGELERAYDLELAPSGARDEATHARLVATRKPGVGRGPKRVELEYDRDTASVVRMTFERLPQAKGGPHALEFVLIDERALPADFFTHVPHHASGREVVFED